MYHVYLLKSEKDGRLYVGYTSDVERRVRAHTAGLVTYTRKYLPGALIYDETFLALEDAKKREKALKDFGKASAQLKSRILDSLKGAG